MLDILILLLATSGITTLFYPVDISYIFLSKLDTNPIVHQGYLCTFTITDSFNIQQIQQDSKYPLGARHVNEPDYLILSSNRVIKKSFPNHCNDYYTYEVQVLVWADLEHLQPIHIQRWSLKLIICRSWFDTQSTRSTALSDTSALSGHGEDSLVLHYMAFAYYGLT